MRVFFSFFLALLFLISCEGDIKNAKKEKNDLNIQTERGTNIQLYYSENGIQKAILQAATMMKQQDTMDKTYFPDGIHLTIFDSLGSINSILTARYGEQDHQNNLMIARDSAKVLNTDGQTMYADKMIWNPQTNKLLSYGKVIIKNKKEIIYGDTLIADENLKIYTVKKISGIVQVQK